MIIKCLAIFLKLSVYTQILVLYINTFKDLVFISMSILLRNGDIFFLNALCILCLYFNGILDMHPFISFFLK